MVEVIVAVVLLAAALMLILALMPAGLLSLKKAENLQTAQGYASELLETAPVPTTLPSQPENFERTLNGNRFEASRWAEKTGPHTYEWTVEVHWPRAQRPVTLKLRRFSEKELP